MELSAEEAVVICDKAGEAARALIFQRVPQKDVVDLDIFVEVVSLRPLTLNVEVEVVLSPRIRKNVDVNSVVKEAVDEAIRVADQAIIDFHKRK